MIGIPEPPAPSEIHLVADWVELACAAEVDGTWSGARLIQARAERDQRERAARGGPTGQSNPAVDDRRQDEAEGVWRALRLRATDFGGSYPFRVHASEMQIETRSRERARMAYLFFLCAASLKAVPSTERHLLTAAFERTAKHAVAGLLPGGSRVAVFGTAADKGTRYKTGNLTTRLRRLAADLGGELTEAGESVSPYSSGDGGLDVVGWPRLAPPNTKLPVIFAQCACGDHWIGKQYEVQPSTWQPRMDVTFRIVPVTVIPYAFRNEEGGWHRPFEIMDGVLVDRLRFLRLLRTRGAPAYAEVPTAWLRDALPGVRAAA